jgi:hypothetical protein
VRSLLDSYGEDQLVFFAGCSDEQATVRFDFKVLVTAPAEVILARLESRTTNPFGKTEPERERVHADMEWVVPLLRGSADLVIETTKPVNEVAEFILDAVEARGRKRVSRAVEISPGTGDGQLDFPPRLTQALNHLGTAQVPRLLRAGRDRPDGWPEREPSAQDESSTWTSGTRWRTGLQPSPTTRTSSRTAPGQEGCAGGGVLYDLVCRVRQNGVHAERVVMPSG